jgi:hypothetical protein
MTTQQTLAGFSEKTRSVSNSMSGFRAWNRVILEWDIDYHGHHRNEDRDWHVDFHVRVFIKEAMIRLKDPLTRKKKEMPGYSLIVFHSMALDGAQPDSEIVYEEPFRINQLPKAFDAFQQEVLNVQSWVEIAESRARLMPKQNDLFECFHCGWVTDIWSEDILCEGCGKRYRSERVWGEETSHSQEAR